MKQVQFSGIDCSNCDCYILNFTVNSKPKELFIQGFDNLVSTVCDGQQLPAYFNDVTNNFDHCIEYLEKTIDETKQDYLDYQLI